MSLRATSISQIFTYDFALLARMLHFENDALTTSITLKYSELKYVGLAKINRLYFQFRKNHEKSRVFIVVGYVGSNPKSERLCF